jgi:hypothetical protein
MPTAPSSRDPLPSDAIRLSVAFERYWRANSADAAAIEAELIAAYSEIEKANQARSARRLEAAWAQWHKAFDARRASCKRAELSFRDLLAAGQLVARVRDPTRLERP